MPRFKPKGTLERTALADLWKHTLSVIPSLCGRLTYLASLRDPNSGQYHHHGLSTAFGRTESGAAMLQSHERVFKEWLILTLAEKSSDLMDYMAGLEEAPGLVAENWLRSRYFDTLPPDRATKAQRAQFRQELQILLETLKNERLRNAGAAGRASPGSAQPS